MSAELSEAEQRVTPYLGGRLTLREIGGVLHISEDTVKTHVRHIYEKLGVSGPRARAHAAALLAGRNRQGGER